jgi:hypothetical protein
VFVLIGGRLLVYTDYNEVAGEVAAAPSQVELPADLPFPVESVRFESENDIRLEGATPRPKTGQRSSCCTVTAATGWGRSVTPRCWRKLAGALLYDERTSGECGGAW